MAARRVRRRRVGTAVQRPGRRSRAGGFGAPTALLFGRRTYQDVHQVWGGRDDNPFSPVLTNKTKYVVTNTLPDPLPWENSVALRGDAVAAVREVKAGSGADLVCLGCGQLVRALLDAGHVDELTLLIHPLLLGQGQPLFRAGRVRHELKLQGCVESTTGVLIATYTSA